MSTSEYPTFLAASAPDTSSHLLSVSDEYRDDCSDELMNTLMSRDE
jgi:hypothetical protein